MTDTGREVIMPQFARSVCHGEVPQIQQGVQIAETKPEADELRELRKENARLQFENEILKKAAAYFAKESL